MRAAKAVVIILAVMIVVAVVAIIWTIFNLDGPGGNRTARTGGAGDLAETVSLGLPPACAVAEIDLDGTRLAVRSEGPPDAPECARVYIVDLPSGRVVSTVAR